MIRLACTHRFPDKAAENKRIPYDQRTNATPYLHEWRESRELASVVAHAACDGVQQTAQHAQWLAKDDSPAQLQCGAVRDGVFQPLTARKGLDAVIQIECFGCRFVHSRGNRTGGICVSHQQHDQSSRSPRQALRRLTCTVQLGCIETQRTASVRLDGVRGLDNHATDLQQVL